MASNFAQFSKRQHIGLDELKLPSGGTKFVVSESLSRDIVESRPLRSSFIQFAISRNSSAQSH